MNTQVSQTGFNGEFSDPILHQYILGNGYRAYNPALQRFTRPDSMSPFGAGGINPYLYCEGDPINRADPTGHMFGVKALLGSLSLGMMVFKDGAEAAAAGEMMDMGVTAAEVGEEQVGQSVEHSVRDTGDAMHRPVGMDNPGRATGTGVDGGPPQPAIPGFDRPNYVSGTRADASTGVVRASSRSNVVPGFDRPNFVFEPQVSEMGAGRRTDVTHRYSPYGRTSDIDRGPDDLNLPRPIPRQAARGDRCVCGCYPIIWLER